MINRGQGGVKPKDKARSIILTIIRVLLVLAFLVGFVDNRRLILAVSILAFVFTFIPRFIRLQGIEFSGDVEVLLILFIYGVLFFWKIQGFYANFQLLSILLSLAASVMLGLVGLTVMSTLHKADKIYASPLVIAFFSFCFAIAVGAVWEAAEFALDSLFGFDLQSKSSFGTMGDLVVYMAGAFIVSTTGYFYIKRGKQVLLSSWLERVIRRNSKLFGISDENHAEKIKEIVMNGEHHSLEFKSSLRMNLHTNQPDKRLEHAVLKTISAYMNSNGGTLLIGVSDKGEILGLEIDRFESDDSMNRHLHHLINRHLGAEFSHLIDANIVNVDGKKVLKIDCNKSNKEVFLKNGNEEEFYVRQGALSTPLTGSSLIQYIESTFRNDKS